MNEDDRYIIRLYNDVNYRYNIAYKVNYNEHPHYFTKIRYNGEKVYIKSHVYERGYRNPFRCEPPEPKPLPADIDMDSLIPDAVIVTLNVRAG